MTLVRLYPVAGTPVPPSTLPGITTVQEYRYALLPAGSYTVWQPYVSGESLWLPNHTPNPVVYSFDFRTQWYDSTILVYEKTTHQEVLVLPTAILTIALSPVIAGTPKKSGVFRVYFDVTETPGPVAQPASASVSYIAKDSVGTARQTGTVSAVLLSKIGSVSTFYADITLGTWDYLWPAPGDGFSELPFGVTPFGGDPEPAPGDVQYGDLCVTASASIVGTPIAPVTSSQHCFVGVWESQGYTPTVSEELLFSDSPLFNSWVYDTYDEFLWEALAATESLGLSNVTLLVSGYIDSYGSEITVEVVSPDGTIWVAFTGDVDFGNDTYFSDVSASTSLFAGETSAGTWIIRIVDSYGDGGCELYSPVLTLEN